MASEKLHKPANEEHKFSQKISEMTAWGTRVFGHKQEHQTAAKHCTTCQCPDTKKKEKNEHAIIAHKDAKHTTCMELKKKEKQHKPSVQAKDSKQPAGVELKKKDNNPKITTTNAGNALGKKDHKGEAVNHWFSSMADHWKEKMMKKGKDGKCNDSSSSSGSDSEDKSCEIKKAHKRRSQVTKTTSK